MRPALTSGLPLASGGLAFRSAPVSAPAALRLSARTDDLGCGPTCARRLVAGKEAAPRPASPSPSASSIDYQLRFEGQAPSPAVVHVRLMVPPDFVTVNVLPDADRAAIV